MRTKKTSRTKDQKRKHRIIIAAMYLEGRVQGDIADVIGISRSQVAEDMGVIRKEWLKSTLIDFNEAKAKELVKLDKLEEEAWKAWKESKEDKKTKSQEGTGAKDVDGNPIITKIALKQENQTGNPQYLAMVKDCIKRRCDILGFDAPKKEEHSGKVDFNYSPVFNPVKAKKGK